MSAIDDFPVYRFLRSPLWDSAGWHATTFRWHPTSEAPPVMAIVFDNADAGRSIFRELGSRNDRFEELRIAIIEGGLTGQREGYSVHLSADPEGLQARATVEDIVLDANALVGADRWNRMYPLPGEPQLLPRFKEEFEKHGQYMFAPVTRRADGRLYVDHELGIVKNCIQFRNLSEITPQDIDVAALKLPELITPRP